MRRRRILRSLTTALSIAVLIGWAGESRADLWGASGTTVDGPVIASADFAINATDHTITVTLENLLKQADFRSSGQSLSDISFILGDAGALAKLSGATASGSLYEFVSSNITGPMTPTSGAPDRWIDDRRYTVDDSTKTITLEALGHGQPAQMILPDYTSFPRANNGVDVFNPYVVGPAVFVLHVNGLTSDTVVTGATFSFGTVPVYIDGSIGPPPYPPSVPEPSSLAITALGALGLLGYGLRRRSSK